MKVLIFLLLATAATAQIQVPDTIYSKINVSNKIATITKTQEKGEQKVTEVNKLNLPAVVTEIKKAEQDTAQYNQYLKMLDNQAEAIRIEKIRIRQQSREAVRYLRRLNEILHSLQ